MSKPLPAAFARLPRAPPRALRRSSGLPRPCKFKRQTEGGELGRPPRDGFSCALATVRFMASSSHGFFQSWLFPVSQGHEFVHDLLQSLQSPFLIGSSDYFFATLQVLAVCFTDFCDFFSQLSNALFDGLRHRDRLAEHFRPG